MASLVCWASGLLDVMMDKDVPLEGGPIVLMTGTAGRVRTAMTAHGEYREYVVGPHAMCGWYVPGTLPVPQDKDAAAVVQHDNMTLVLAFNKKLVLAQAKAKGRGFYLETLKRIGDE